MNQQVWDISIEHLDGGYEGRLVLQDFSAVLPAGMESITLSSTL